MKKTIVIIWAICAVFAAGISHAEESKAKEKETIAVVDFSGQNVSAMDALVVTGFLRTALVNLDVYKVVDRNNMETVLAEQGFQMTGCTTEDCAVKIGKILNVNKMVIGSLSKLMDVYYVTANIVDVETGEITASKRAQTSSGADLAAAVDELAGALISGKEVSVKKAKAIAASEDTAKARSGVFQPKKTRGKKGGGMIGLRFAGSFKPSNGDELVSYTLYKKAYDGAKLFGVYMLFKSPDSPLGLEMAYDRFSRQWDVDGYGSYTEATAKWSLSMASMSLILKAKSIVSPYAGVGFGLYWWRDKENYQQYYYSTRYEHDLKSSPALGYQLIYGIDVTIAKIITAGLGVRMYKVSIDEVNYTLNGDEMDPIDGDFGVSGKTTELHVAVNF